jgi:hypothetical protein
MGVSFDALDGFGDPAVPAYGVGKSPRERDGQSSVGPYTERRS